MYNYSTHQQRKEKIMKKSNKRHCSESELSVEFKLDVVSCANWNRFTFTYLIGFAVVVFFLMSYPFFQLCFVHCVCVIHLIKTKMQLIGYATSDFTVSGCFAKLRRSIDVLFFSFFISFALCSAYFVF